SSGARVTTCSTSAPTCATAASSSGTTWTSRKATWSGPSGGTTAASASPSTRTWCSVPCAATGSTTAAAHGSCARAPTEPASGGEHPAYRLLHRERRCARVGSVPDGTSDDDVVGALAEGLLHVDGALLVL